MKETKAIINNHISRQKKREQIRKKELYQISREVKENQTIIRNTIKKLEIVTDELVKIIKEK